MSRQRYTAKIEMEAVKPMTEKGKPIAGYCPAPRHVGLKLYAWIKLSKPQEQRRQ